MKINFFWKWHEDRKFRKILLFFFSLFSFYFSVFLKMSRPFLLSKNSHLGREGIFCCSILPRFGQRRGTTIKWSLLHSLNATEPTKDWKKKTAFENSSSASFSFSLRFATDQKQARPSLLIVYSISIH